jgi:hypothetical protein
MAEDLTHDVPSRDPAPAATRFGDRLNLNKLSWGAIWAGVVITIGMEALFLSFGLFIAGVLGGSDAWSIAWYLVTMCLAFYAGSRSAVRLSNVADRDICILHGLSTWGLATLATMLIEGMVWFAALLKTPLPIGATVRWGPAELYGRSNLGRCHPQSADRVCWGWQRRRRFAGCFG